MQSEAEQYAKQIRLNLYPTLDMIKPVDIENYSVLMEDYQTADAANDKAYQNKFIRYYRMRSDGAYNDRFFIMMQNIKQNAQPDLKTVATELYKKTGKHQFSFITKMLHTRFPDYPIFDSHVGKFFSLHRLDSVPFEKKLKRSVEIMETMQEYYQYFAANHLLDDCIQVFDSRFTKDISFVKKVDFLIWGLVKYRSALQWQPQTECGACGGTMDEIDIYCRHCGKQK